MSQAGRPKILVVNPGSTSTRVAVFLGEEKELEAALPSPPGTPPSNLWNELPSRLGAIRSWVNGEAGGIGDLAAVVGRGGLLRPLEGGTYAVTDSMLADARGGRRGSHPSNLGCALARALADEAGAEWGRPVPAFVVDPVSTDEFVELARYSGLRDLPRVSLSHALSIHALVREVCGSAGRSVEGSRFVVGHLGGGISVCPVLGGRILDANNANSGGPFSPTRAGGLPTQGLIALCFSGRHTEAEVMEMTVKRGGLLSHLGTDDAEEVERRIEAGDRQALVVYEAMAYQIAKEIGAMATVLEGRVDKILLTGGLAGSLLLTAWIRSRVGFLAPVEVWPEPEEMKALALGALAVLNGEIPAKEY